MEKTTETYRAYIKILEEELVPAMGCTEPIAIAYGAAKGREVLGALPDEVLVEASGNIIKNVKSVVVPNTGGLHGIEAAAAAGVVAGQADLLLEVISQVTPEQQAEMRTYLKEHPVRVEFLDGELVFDIQITLRRGTDTVKVRIANYHTNIVHLEHNGQVLLDLPVEADDESGLTDRTLLSMADIYDFAQTVDIADIKELLDRQIQCNMAISQEGLTHSYGANIGQVIRAASPADDLIAKAKSAAAAGSDARMGGCEMPVIINSGSGNQGMTASVPVIVYAQGTGASQEKLYRALALSNLITIHQKTRIGRLSAYCGAVSAGAAAGAGIAYLDGSGYEEIIHTVVNALAIVSGMICDGAKASCAGKIAAAIDAGVLGYRMYQQGQQFYGGDGILSHGVEKTLDNVGRLGKIGMRSTDKEILQIMLQT
ncbi:MAG: serine dehydratase subunit alpha family protein [Lawsonibacter sp.]|nr:serine dehydratase subunit alpha family protein [Lawsonibacter sp.]MCI8990577.1 serine dehydratase subunit alpha family protein [Lawsonibacter sp.]MCI9269357.1 serine dehydratase subunit alpha family protein [Lawsonibacter sp.]